MVCKESSEFKAREWNSVKGNLADIARDQILLHTTSKKCVQEVLIPIENFHQKLLDRSKVNKVTHKMAFGRGTANSDL